MLNKQLESIQGWSEFMKTSSTLKFRSVVGKIMMGLVLAAMIGSINVGPALGKDDHKQMEKGDHKQMGKHDNGRSEYRGRGYDHKRYVYGRRDYQPYGYGEQVYVGPPVVYAPPPPVGIGIFLPIPHIYIGP